MKYVKVFAAVMWFVNFVLSCWNREVQLAMAYFMLTLYAIGEVCN